MGARHYHNFINLDNLAISVKVDGLITPAQRRVLIKHFREAGPNERI